MKRLTIPTQHTVILSRLLQYAHDTTHINQPCRRMSHLPPAHASTQPKTTTLLKYSSGLAQHDTHAFWGIVNNFKETLL